MELPGERKCTDCGERWSYYDAGSVQCPACGSVRSVGVGERAEHTDGAGTLDLTPVRASVDEQPVATVAERAASRAADYVRTAGFVHAGELQPLDGTYLAAAELRRVARSVARALRVGDDEERYLLVLLAGADEGDRPAPGDVPEELRAERGLAVAATADAYTSDVRRVVGGPTSELASVLSSVRTERKRIEALDGDVDPRAAERLVTALRDLGAYLREDDETALVRAGDRL